MPPQPPTVAELQAVADHARERVALYRRRVYLGRGTAERLAELERIAHGAADRLARARREASGRPD